VPENPVMTMLAARLLFSMKNPRSVYEKSHIGARSCPV